MENFGLYKVGGAIAPLSALNADSTWAQLWLPSYIALGELERFINQSVYVHAIKSSRGQARALIELLKELSQTADKPDTKNEPIGAMEAYRLSQAVSAFEVVITAEFGLTPIFLITPKRGYELGSLINSGASFFPDSFRWKVPDAISDANLGMRCLAFELQTAAAFHFHRVNEAVLRKYWEALMPGKPHPGNQTTGEYLRALKLARKGSPKVKATLRDIKDLYRNPVSHPGYQLENVDEAIAVFNSIHTAVVLMLKVIPDPPKTS